MHFFVSFFIKCYYICENFHSYSKIMKNSQKLWETASAYISYWGRVGRGSWSQLTCDDLFSIFSALYKYVSNNLWSWCSYFSSLLSQLFSATLYLPLCYFSFYRALLDLIFHFCQCSLLDPSILWIIKVCS